MRATSSPARESPISVQSWSSEQFDAHADEAMSIYARAMEYPDAAGGQRAVTARRHVHNTGFACRVATLGDGTLIGFGYGYTTSPGQWWHDLVRKALAPDTVRDWLADAFELSELHMEPDYQGNGIGRRLLLDLAAGIPHSSILLSTPEGDTRAFRMYRRLGFQDLRRRYLFPGDARPFAVLGARLPLPES